MPGAKWIWLIAFITLLALPSARGQVVVNELLANNKSFAPLPDFPDYFPDFVELYNNSDTPIDLGAAGWRIGDSGTNFSFTVGTIIPARGFLIVLCDDDTTIPGVHTKFGLNASEGETVTLFLGLSQTETHTIGIQVADFSLGRVPDVSGSLQLCTPTPGETNVAVTLGNRFTLKVNEWLATNSAGADKDWFEIYNPDSNAVSLAGIIFADRGSSNRVGSLSPLRAVPALSFIAPFGFVQIFASDDDKDADEVKFSLSSSNGDEIWIFNSDNPADVIDHISFGPDQSRNTSEGRLPDGGDYIGPGNVNIKLKNLSPGASNFNPLPEIVISEALAHVDPPLEDAIELHNPTTTNVTIGNWWISNNRNNPKKFQIPPGTIIEAGGYKTFYEYQFNSGAAAQPFNLNSAHGDEIYLFKADSSGDLLGFRRGLTFSASENGVSFGRWINSQTNSDFVPMSTLSLGSSITRNDSASAGNIAAFRAGRGAANTYPKVGPVIINEVHYHPPDIISGNSTNDNSVDEFVELHNLTSQTVPLFDPMNYFYQAVNYADGRTNTWRLRGGVSYTFPTNISLAANSYLLVVNFDPETNLTQLASFKSLFNVPDSVQIFGPYKGKLSNGGAAIELYKPDPPQGPPLHDDERGFVPYIFVDAVKYNDKAPWPLAPDGAGASLQRRVSVDYANDPANWKGAAPTAGRANAANSIAAPNITTDPVDLTGVTGGEVTFSVVASGNELSYRWQYNGVQINGATNATLRIANLSTNMAGTYRAVAINPAGIDYSASASLTVLQDLNDTTIPTVAISSPNNNARVTTSTITVSGSANDNISVAYVELQLNDGEFETVTGTTSWSQEVTLVPGPNTINVRSTDIATNQSAIVTRTVTYVVTDTLNLTINGQGSVTGLKGTAPLEVGKSFTLTAKPDSGFVFSNWTGDVSDVSPKLTFVMIEGMEIAANFVPNPFLPVAGIFNGLFHEDPDGAGVRPESAGFFSLKLTTKGSYSAQLLLGGSKYSARGALDLEGRGTATITRSGLNNLTVNWQVALDGSDTISGTITDGSWTADITGDRLVFHPKFNPAAAAGRYTFVVPGSPGSPNAPAGDSYGSLLVTTSGKVVMVGSLAENIKMTQKTALSKNGDIPLYYAPYSGSGIFAGWIALAETPTTDLAGDVTWMKPSSAGGTYYPAGFTNDATLAGSIYVKPDNTAGILNLTDGLFTLTGGNLPDSLTNSFTLPPGSKVIDNGPHKLSLKFVSGTGLFKGVFIPAGTSTKVMFNGALLQSSTNASGYFLGTDQVGRVAIEPAP